jgi:hypothetical protein
MSIITKMLFASIRDKRVLQVAVWLIHQAVHESLLRVSVADVMTATLSYLVFQESYGKSVKVRTPGMFIE